MIRVLHLIKTLGLGGAETNLLNLVTAFDAERVENHIGYSRGGEIEAAFLRLPAGQAGAGVRLFKYSEKEHKVKSAASAAIVARLASYIRKNRIDIVHTHSFNAHVWGVLAAKLSGAKIVEHVHDFRYLELDDFKRRRGSVSQFGYIKFFKGWSDRVVVLTQGNVEYLLKHRFYPSSKIAEIQNGIPMTEPSGPSEELRKRFAVPPGAPVIVTPIRFAHEKNVDLILEIAPKVLARQPQTRFVIAGDGPLLEECRKKAREIDPAGRLVLPGFFENVRELLSIADICLLPSFLELHSIAVLEALSARVPVIASSGVGCNSEVFTNGKNALLLDPFSREGWAEAVISLLEDETRRKAVGGAGYELCRERFEIKRVAKKFEELYAGLSRK